MAKIKWGMMVVDGRGKLGGHVLTKNRSGAIARTKVTPSNPQTQFQSLVRSIMATISQAWSSLDIEEIKAWNAAVQDWQRTNEFGDKTLLSGKSLHQSLNQNLLLIDSGPITTPPAKMEVPADVLEAAEFTIPSGELDLTGASTAAGSVIVVEATPPVSLGTTNVKNRYRRIYFVGANSYSATAAYNGYVDRFGIPVADQKIFVRVKYIMPNGQASVPQAVEATVTL